MDRVYLTIVNNPFDPIKDREQRSFLYDPIPIGAYIKKANIVTFPGDELNIVYGGRPLTKEEIDSVIPMPGDRFVAIPMVAGGGGEDTQKQVLSVVAMVALMYVGGIGGAALFGEGTTGAAVFAAGVQMVGGYLINNYMQKRLKQDDQGDKTYGWEITTNMVPGGAIPETCGTVRTGGTCISYHVTCDGDKQYANILLDGGIGPLDIDETTGEVTGIDINSILINNEPFANYNGQNSTLPEVYIRPGTNDQEIIPNFGDIFDTQAFGDELKVGDEYVTHEINSDGAKGLEVTFLCPKGLYRLDGSSYETANILLDIQYCKFGETEWRSFPVSTGSQYIQYDASPVIGSGPHGNPTPPKAVVIKGDCRANFSVGMQVLVFSTKDPEYETITEIAYDNSQTHITFDSLIPWKTYAIGYMASTTGQLMLEGSTPRAFRKSFRIDNIPQGQYYVRSKCLFKSGSDTDQKYAVQIFWESLSYIIYDDFCYPNHILLGIKALASDKLSGSISNITWIQSVSKCWVWNPNTQAYEQKDKTNPAWRAYDIYHQAQRLKNINTGEYEMIVRGEAAHKINYPQFERWANFCDAYGLKCNYIHDKTVTRSEALAPIHLVGRGRTFQSGTQISCDFDVPVFEPTQVFTAADVCAGGITYEYINTRDRANAVEVKFRDAARNYEWHTFPIYGEEYESDTGVQNPTQITLDACTDYTQAYRHGVYELKVNAGILRSASFTAELKSLGCVVGDVVGLLNELPRWGTGGRIVEVGDNWIKIDKTVTFEAGKSYYVTYRLSNDDLVKQGASSTSAQRLVMQFGMAAQGQGDGTTNILQVSEPFVEDTEAAVKVDSTHFEVNGNRTAVYISGLSPVLEFGFGETNVVPVIGSAYDSIADKTTVETAGFVPDDLETVRFAFTKPRLNDMYAFGEPQKLYKLFKITSISLDGEQRRKITALEHIPEVYQDGADIPPEIDWTPGGLTEVESIRLNEETYQQKDGTSISNILVSWMPPRKKQTVEQYMVYLSENGGVSWRYILKTNALMTTITGVKTRCDYLVKVCTTDGLAVSGGTISNVLTVTGKDRPPKDVAKLTVLQSGDTLKAIIQENSEPDINYYELRVGPSWENSAFVRRFIGNFVIFPISQEGTLTYWVKAVDNSGNQSAIAVKSIINVFGLKPVNVIYQRQEDILSWTSNDCYLCPSGKWRVKSVEKLGDYATIGDMFGTGMTLKSAAEIILAPIDLGQNSMEPDCYYSTIDGLIKILSVEKLGDYETFGDMFGTGITLITPQYHIETFLRPLIGYNQTPNTRVDVEYRTSADGLSWGAWSLGSEERFFGRFIQLKLLSVINGNVDNTDISSAITYIDVPDVEETIENVSVLAEKTRITFHQRFFAPPSSIAIFTTDSAGTMATYRISNVTATSFDLEILDNTGNLISGMLQRADIKGY